MIQGSVKNIHQESDGKLRFEFTDDYSVFDYGKMPQSIPGKGLITAELAEWFFKVLEANNIHSHFIRRTENAIIVHEYLTPRPLQYPVGKSGQIVWEYGFENLMDCVVPIEAIFRWGAPAGSSYLKRHPDAPTGCWDTPIIEFTTKREPVDRLLSYQEASLMIGCYPLYQLHVATVGVADVLKEIFDERGMVLWDGKLEWAFDPDEGNVTVLVDSIGPDELRVELDGEILSKQYLRDCYQKLGWTNDDEGGPPPPLSSKQIEDAARIYKLFRDRIIG